MPNFSQYYDDKIYQEIQVMDKLSVEIIMLVHNVFPFPPDELDLALCHLVGNVKQTTLAEIHKSNQPSINYILNSKIRTKIGRVLEWMSLIPEYLKICKELEIDNNMMACVTLALYCGSGHRASNYIKGANKGSAKHMLDKFFIKLKHAKPNSKLYKHILAYHYRLRKKGLNSKIVYSKAKTVYKTYNS
jgi:hypothetical protein